MKSQVTVLGRREGYPRLHRMWVYFNVDYRHAPSEVILTVAPFCRGEAIARQGHEAHHLYIISRGEVEVRVALETGESKRVALLRAGEVFGEMGLMTGEPRTASVIALSDVICYRLDKEGFADALRRRPELAEAVSHLLAKRKVELDATTEGLNIEAARHRAARVQEDLLHRIRRFFSLG